MPLAAGARIGPYQVMAPIGAGGMGEVYRVRDDRLGREVALKILPADFHTDADRLRRFGDEGRAAGGLSHPGILAVHDVGEHEGAPYIVSELLEGETLRERLDNGRLLPRKALEYGTQIAQALAAAHEKGIIHRNGDLAVRIASGKAFALAPDGKLALVAPEPPWANLTLVPTGAGEPKPQPSGPITTTFEARFTSHAGRWVLLALGPTGQPRLWLQEDGQPPKPFGPDEIWQLFEVSPDDKVVAVRVHGDSLLVPLDGGPPRKLEGLAANDVPVAFSGDGKAVLVARGPAGIFAYDVATRKLTKLFGNPAAGANGKPSRGFIARDGKAFVYSLRVTSSELFLVEGLR